MALARMYCGVAAADVPSWLTVAVVDDAGRLLDLRHLSDDPTGYAHLGVLLGDRISGSPVAVDSPAHLVTQLLAAANRPLSIADVATAADFADRFCDETSYDEIQAPITQRRAVGLARALQAGALYVTAQSPSVEFEQFKPLLAAHAAVTAARQAAAVALREVLRELYPAALRAYPDPAEYVPLRILEAMPEPGLLAISSTSQSRDAALVAEMSASGVADTTTATGAITALRVAVTEAPRWNTHRSLAPVVAETVRQAVAAVRACDSAAAALIATVENRLDPTGGAGASMDLGATPGMGASTRPRLVPSAPVSPAPRRAAGPAVSAPAGRSTQVNVAGAPSVGIPPAGYPAATVPAAASIPAPRPAPGPAPGSRSRWPLQPVADDDFANTAYRDSPGMAPAGPASYEPDPAFHAPADTRHAYPAHDYPAHDYPSGDYGTTGYRATGYPEADYPEAAQQPPDNRLGGLRWPGHHADPPQSEALAYDRQAPSPPQYNEPLYSEPSYGEPSYSEPQYDPSTYPAELYGQQLFGQSYAPPDRDQSLPRRRADHATREVPREPDYLTGDYPHTPLANPAASATAPHADTDTSSPGPGYRTDDLASPLSFSADPLTAPLDQPRSQPAPGSPEGGPARPPWQDMPPEPPPLHLVETPRADPLTDPLQDRTGPPVLRVIDGDGPGRRHRRAHGSDRPATPAGDADGDLLIFSQAAQSAWFSEPDEEAGPAESAGWDRLDDDGWRVAGQAAHPAVGADTMAGLPRRVPQANLVPGTAQTPSPELRIVRDAQSIADHTDGYFRGWRRGQQIGGFAVGQRDRAAWEFNRDQRAREGVDQQVRMS